MISSLQTAIGGRSNSLIFFTFDNKFAIKTITKTEKNLFLNILNDYQNRVCKIGSRLVRVAGLYSLMPIKINFMIMESTVFDRKKVVMFDIKGSSHDRLVEGKFDYQSPPFGMVLKDINLIQSEYKVDLNQSEKQEILNDLKEDFEILAKNGIMDYSVILGFYHTNLNPQTRYEFLGKNSLYSLGIVDFLQSFNIKKKSEKFFKKLFHRKAEVSSETPEVYKERINFAMFSIFNRKKKGIEKFENKFIINQ